MKTDFVTKQKDERKVTWNIRAYQRGEIQGSERIDITKCESEVHQVKVKWNQIERKKQTLWRTNIINEVECEQNRYNVMCHKQITFGVCGRICYESRYYSTQSCPLSFLRKHMLLTVFHMVCWFVMFSFGKWLPTFFWCCITQQGAEQMSVIENAALPSPISVRKCLCLVNRVVNRKAHS